jgi:hypothetical protein
MSDSQGHAHAEPHGHGHGHGAARLHDVVLPPKSLWNKLPLLFAVLGVAGIGGAIALSLGNLKQFYFSYLVSFLFFLSLALGGLFFVQLQFAVRAGWSVTVRRIAENAMSTLPLFVLLFVPIIFGLHDLFHWTHKEEVAKDPWLAGKAGYLNDTFFYVRSALYLAIWIGLSTYFYRQSTKQDQTGEIQRTSGMQKVSGIGLLLQGLTLSFASFDWIMSLDPHWYSTIFGAYYFAGSAVGVYAFMILMGLALRGSGLLKNAITQEHFHDLGKLLFGFTMFWAYLAFSQFFLIWYANIPEETVWFYHRLQGNWRYVSYGLAIGHFVVPFFFLMTRITKRHNGLLFLAACWMLGIHLLDHYWLVMPILHKHGVHLTLQDLLCFVGVGGLFMAVVTYRMKRHSLVPQRDPRLHEALAFENM